jgi:peptidoglycan-N-acetylglucosamine deacetylase
MLIFSTPAMKSILSFSLFFLMCMQGVFAQNDKPWNGKQCAVVLTYDDCLNVHLDNVIPCLDSAALKGTFYVIGSSSVLSKRMDEWRKAAAEGHELGNHTLNHPCDGRGRSFVTAENDLSLFSVERAVNEIRITNTLLKAIDGKTERTFAFPCGDTKIGDVRFYEQLENEFAGARGVRSGLQQARSMSLNDIHCYMMNNSSAQDLITLVDQAMSSHALLVFLFHGVGGEHDINVSKEAHSQLIHYLRQNQKDIWVAPMVDVAKYVRAQKLSTSNE